MNSLIQRGLLFFLLPGILMLHPVDSIAAVHAEWITDPTGTSSSPIPVPQGVPLVLELPEGVSEVTYEGETYLAGTVPVRGNKDNTVLLPIGLRQDLGDFHVSATQNGRNIQLPIRVVAPAWPEQSITLPSQKHVDLSATDAARVQRENVAIGKAFKLRTPSQFTDGFATPFTSYTTGNRFGSRRIINGQPRSRHTGADYGLPAGEPVLSIGAGKVVIAEEHFFAGNSVFVDHGDGLVSMYFHLSKINVAIGDQVRAGQQIGLVGATGRATGPHLHYGLRYRGKILDPDDVLQILGAVAPAPVITPDAPTLPTNPE